MNQKKIEALRSLESLSPDLRFLIIRSVLDVRLLNKMAWQAHYGSDSVVLGRSDVLLIEEYRQALETALYISPQDSLSAKLIPKLLIEADFVLESTKFSTRARGGALSCKGFL